MAHMEKPMFSIVIPALNEETFLPLLLTSLSEQTDKDFEVIVVDGQSEDKTIAVAKKFTETLPHLTVVTSPVRCLPDQRNYGASLAHGEWFIFSDADNIFLPYAIAQMKRYITTHKKEKPKLIASWCQADSELVSDSLIALFSNMVTEGSLSVKHQFTPGPLTIVKRSVFETIGGYTNGLRWGEDMDFGDKMQKAGVRLSIIREVLYVWSMRRLRSEGKIKFAQQAVRAALHMLLTNKALTKGYEMGGQLYKKKKTVNVSVMKRLTVDIKKLLEEVFE